MLSFHDPCESIYFQSPYPTPNVIAFSNNDTTVKSNALALADSLVFWGDIENEGKYFSFPGTYNAVFFFHFFFHFLTLLNQQMEFFAQKDVDMECALDLTIAHVILDGKGPTVQLVCIFVSNAKYLMLNVFSPLEFIRTLDVVGRK